MVRLIHVKINVLKLVFHKNINQLPKEKEWRGARGHVVLEYAEIRGFTRHIQRLHQRVCRAADAQLPIAVVAPALDPAPARDDAHVGHPMGDGDGREAWRGKRGEEEERGRGVYMRERLREANADGGWSINFILIILFIYIIQN
jgi:hypothetical protein